MQDHMQNLYMCKHSPQPEYLTQDENKTLLSLKSVLRK